MGHLYFVRHGQTDFNVKDIICGDTDIPLTELGHEQAIETGRKIIEQGIQADLILHSDLIRAVQTATHISQMTGIPMQADHRLIEQSYGRFEGTSGAAEEFFRAKQCFAYNYDGGESMFRLAHRIYSVLDDIRKMDKTVIIVAHNGLARVINSYFYDMGNEEFAAFGVQNCEIKEWTWED